MKAKILILLLFAIGSLVAITIAMNTDGDYCRHKLGCSNWKREWKRCHKWCMGSIHHHKRDVFQEKMERLLYDDLDMQ
jgi:hypothetical protein